MTLDEAKAIIDALVTLRCSATDEQAPKGERVLYNDVLYNVLNDHTSQTDWAPNVAPSLFAKILIPDKNVVLEWEQPESTNPYGKGDKVAYNGKTWQSTTDGNVWKPGVYGWEEITE